MAVTATFIADFAAFDRAVQHSSASLKSFEQDANKVGVSLNRMVDQFSGRKLIADATLMTKAVEEIGGVTKLTDSEIKRLGTTVTEAANKMRALGIDVPQKFKDIETATRGATSAGQSWSDWLRSANGILAAFGASLSIGALVAFGKTLLQMGDDIVRVADRTGLTTEEVQRLGYVATQSGNSLEDLTGAIGQMQNRLTEGDKSAIASVERLGINLATLQSAGPAQQLELIATAIAKVPDPAERTRIAMDLFGKAGAAILPLLTAQFRDLAAAAPVMSDNTVRALDRAGDELNRFGLQIKVWAAESYLALRRVFDGMVAGAYNAAAALNETIVSMGRAAEKVPGMGTVFRKLGVDLEQGAKDAQWFRDAAKAMAQPLDETTLKARQLAPAMRTLGSTFDTVATQTAKTGTGIKTIKTEVDKLLPSQGSWALGIGQLNTRMVDLSGHLADQQQMFAGLRGSMGGVVDTYDDLVTVTEDLAAATLRLNLVETQTGAIVGGTVAPAMTTLLKGLDPAPIETYTDDIDTLGESFEKAFGDLPELFIKAFTGGGGISGALKAFGTRVTQELFGQGGAFSGMTKAVSGMFGKDGIGGAIAKSLGALLPGIGALIGPAIEGIKKLFRSAEQEINPVRKGFVDMAGGLDALRDKATEAGVTINALLNAKNVEQYTQAVNDLNAAFDEHAADIDKAKSIMEEYGIALEETGQKWRDQELNNQTKDLIDTYRVMVDVLGLSVPAATEKMAGKFNDFIHTAQAVGYQVPAEMKPILEQMVQLGLLTDAQGNKYGSLEDAGLTFAETFAQSVDRLIVKFDEFMKRIGLVPQEIAKIPTYRDVYVDIHQRYHNEGDAPVYHQGGIVMHAGGLVPARVLPFVPRAHAGLATDEVPIIAQRGEGILSRADMTALGGGSGFNALRQLLKSGGAGGGTGAMEVTAELKRLRQEMAADRMTAPMAVARAVRDEVQKARRGRR